MLQLLGQNLNAKFKREINTQNSRRKIAEFRSSCELKQLLVNTNLCVHSYIPGNVWSLVDNISLVSIYYSPVIARFCSALGWGGGRWTQSYHPLLLPSKYVKKLLLFSYLVPQVLYVNAGITSGRVKISVVWQKHNSLSITSSFCNNNKAPMNIWEHFRIYRHIFIIPRGIGYKLLVPSLNRTDRQHTTQYRDRFARPK